MANLAKPNKTCFHRGHGSNLKPPTHFQAKLGTHLPTSEGWKAELTLVARPYLKLPESYGIVWLSTRSLLVDYFPLGHLTTAKFTGKAGS